MHAVRATSGHPIRRIAFSPCGRWFASAQPHTGVVLYDRASGEPVRTLGSVRQSGYASLVFMNGSDWVAASGPKGLEVHDTGSGSLVFTTPRRYAAHLRLGVCGDTVLAGSGSLVLELIIPTHADGHDRRVYWNEPNVGYIDMSPDAKWGVGFRPGASPVVIDLHAKRLAHALRHPATIPVDEPYSTRWLPTIGFARHAPRLAFADGATVAAFDLHPANSADNVGSIPTPLLVEQPVFTLNPPDGWPAEQPWRQPFALTPDGRKLLVKRPRERVQMWDIDAGTLDAEWSWRMEGITCLAVAPDGLTAVAGGRFGRVLTWDLE